ncbi:alpha/beta-hydrolase [Anaeromyces robustus]|uniref:Carboxylic ester hydrolase n=1 Tax=Anaeromyces robustus TaxID=1754192 RepID=A0A1Y1W9J4_9FUNG|nr:alpha/beta-hydrolase [Anaeromyces robustus]|eukprot:ORX69824.1 alpha/beta-hydrolase [Anaeromyces robustus]
MEFEFECEAGKFKGYETETNCIQIKGIRYAISNRYEEPRPYRYDKNKVQECKEPSPYGIQINNPVDTFLMGLDCDTLPQEESCQYLSITLPKGTTSQHQLPVMVYIHGGSYLTGGCDNPCFDREPLVKENQIIVVGINYRLGVLGFVKDKTGNYANLGLLDIIMGLKWVKENISDFGGDSNNITIFGQSAGGESVRCVMLAKGTENLYHRAIIQSDPIGTMVNRDKMEKKILDQLHKVPLDASIETIKKTQGYIGSHVTHLGYARFMFFGPHFGIYPLPPQEEIPQRLKEIANDHDLLIGSTLRESSIFVGYIKLIVLLHKFFITRWIIEKIIKKTSKDIFIDPSKKFAYDYVKASKTKKETDTITMSNIAMSTTNNTNTNTNNNDNSNKTNDNNNNNDNDNNNDNNNNDNNNNNNNDNNDNNNNDNDNNDNNNNDNNNNNNNNNNDKNNNNNNNNDNNNNGSHTYHYTFSWSENNNFNGAGHTLELLGLFGGKAYIGRDIAMGLSEKELYDKGQPLRKIWGDFAKTGRITQNKIEGMIDIEQL